MDSSASVPNSPDHQSELTVRYEEAISHYCLVSKLNEAASHTDQLHDLCIALVNILIEFTTAENCSIMLNDPVSGKLNTVVAKGRNDVGSFYGLDGSSCTVFMRGEGAAGWAAENEQLLSINDCETDSRFVMKRNATKDVKSVICAPVRHESNVIGVINCSHPKKQKFSEEDEHVVSLVARQAGSLLQKALLIKRLKDENGMLLKQAAEKQEHVQEIEQNLDELREQLYKSEKFATLGELLAGVAHELNNRVAPILIYSQMLKEKAADNKNEKRLQIIEESAMGAKAILETLLNYSRTGTKEEGPVNLNQTLQSTLTLVEYKLRNHGIKTCLDLCPHLPPALVNERKIAQVFLNLINNALSAMEENGGQLMIRSGYDQHSIRFSFADTGPGIPEEIADKIFAPFFTTKASGKGTGLGLSISKRYLEEHKGKIFLEKPDIGARFIIEIPRTDVRTTERAQEPIVQAPAPYDSELPARILVVEDDSTIRDVIRDILGTRYEVEFATDGNEATSKIENDLFDLLVVDYHMPGLDGRQLYEWISHNRPSLKRRVVFSTGDIFHDDIRNFIKGTGCHSLTKPFSTSDLRETISGVLTLEA